MLFIAARPSGGSRGGDAGDESGGSEILERPHEGLGANGALPPAVRRRSGEELASGQLSGDRVAPVVLGVIHDVCAQQEAYRAEGNDADTALERAMAATSARRRLMERLSDEEGRPRALSPDVAPLLRDRAAKRSCAAIVVLWMATFWRGVVEPELLLEILQRPPGGSRLVAYEALDAAGGSGAPSLVQRPSRALG